MAITACTLVSTNKKLCVFDFLACTALTFRSDTEFMIECKIPEPTSLKKVVFNTRTKVCWSFVQAGHVLMHIFLPVLCSTFIS